MMYDELDWEDIESRLYSQVYHASAENQENTTPTTSNISVQIGLQSKSNAVNALTKFNYRYFSKKDAVNSSPMYISLDSGTTTGPETVCSSMQNNICLGPNSIGLSTEGNFVGNFQNNITVNQYASIPVVINSETYIPASNDKHFTLRSTKRQKLLDKKERKRHKRIEKRKEKNKDKKLKSNGNDNFSSLMVELNVSGNERKVNDVICISDESNSECIFVQNIEMSNLTKTIPTGFPKKYNENDEHSKKPESDDDIIYIPPPPIEVINVDVEENTGKTSDIVKERQENDQKVLESQNAPSFSNSTPNKVNYNPKERKELLCTPESSASNDFLDNASIENNTNKFNFSLHGSDFSTGPGDFVRPANPVDFCETESSCSTNELNRNFNNSVKTVVFDEVEFPREDIFSENNLESFGSYITPKRNTTQKIPVNRGDPENFSKRFECSSSSDDSSSESDFEPSEGVKDQKSLCVESNRKLPNLSPMQFSEMPVFKKKMSKRKTASEFFKDKSKITLQNKKDSTKRKSDVIEILEADSDSNSEKHPDSGKRQAKKKHKMSHVETINACKKKKGHLSGKRKKHTVSELGSEKSQSKKKKPLLEIYSSESESSDHQVILDMSHKKKKKTRSDSKSSDNGKRKKSETKDVGSNKYSNDTEVKKKKKKSISLESAETSELEDTNEAQKLVKKKKSVSADNSDNENNCGQKITEKQSKKRRKSCSGSSTKSSEIDIEDDSIDLAVTGEGNKEIDENDKNKVESESNKLQKEECLNLLPEGTTLIAENKDRIDDGKILDHNVKNDAIEVSKDFVDRAEISAIEEGRQNSSDDEEIVVDDEIDSNMSSLIVVDEANSTTVAMSSLIVVDEVISSTANEENIEILLSSDSEDDIGNLADVGNKIQLANCSIEKVIATEENEFVVVDDNSEGNSISCQKSQRDYYEFDVEAIHRTQTDDPESWRISHKDRMLHLMDRSKGPRCNRCRQFGHIAIRCSEKTGPPKCSLCGSPGHQEPRCTNKICTQCGNKGDYSTTYCWRCFKFRNSVCRICNMRGHIAKTCPDLWRRYHLTTEEGPIVVSQEPQLKSRDAQWCSGCAKQGHLEHECTYYNRAYPPTNPCIISYEDVLYNTNIQRVPQEQVSTPLANIPSNQNISSVFFNAAPNPNSIPPLMSLKIGPSILNQQERVVVQTSTNYVVSVSQIAATSAEVLNPPAVSISPGTKNAPHSKNPVLDQMRLNYLNEADNLDEWQLIDPQTLREGTRVLCRNDQRRIKHIIMSMPCHKVKEFLKREMADLEDVATQSNPRYLKKMFFKYDKLSKSKRLLRYEELKEKCFWYRILNIFIFGVHHFKDGKFHLNFLKSYLSEPKRSRLDLHKRKSLFSSYNYIFGVDRHVNINYYKVIQRIIQRHDQGSDKYVS